MLDPLLPKYHPNETAQHVADPRIQHEARRRSVRPLAKNADVSEKTVMRARRGEPLRNSTRRKLEKALKSLPVDAPFDRPAPSERYVSALRKLRRELQRYTNEQLQVASGLSERTIRRIRNGHCHPRPDTEEALRGAVERLESERRKLEAR